MLTGSAAVPEVDARLGREDPFAREIGAVQASLADVARGHSLARLVEHALGAPGKRLRSRLVLASAALGPWSDSTRDDAIRGAAAVELLHEASLIHDDICDGSELRRGVPSLAAAFDVRSAALTATYLAGRGLSICGELAERRGLELDVGLLVTLSHGQILEGAARDILRVEDMKATYLRVVRAKTGALFRMACRLGGSIGGATRAELAQLDRFANALAVVYQVLDDVRDIEAPTSLGKAAGGDIARGILTWPMLAWLTTHGDPAAAAEALLRPGKSPQEVERLRRELLAAGATESAAAFARGQVDDCETALSALPVSPGARHLRDIARRAARVA